jgi:hypothetical protein
MTFFWLWCLLGLQNWQGAYERGLAASESDKIKFFQVRTYAGSTFYRMRGKKIEVRWYDCGGKAD